MTLEDYQTYLRLKETVTSELSQIVGHINNTMSELYDRFDGRGEGSDRFEDLENLLTDILDDSYFWTKKGLEFSCSSYIFPIETCLDGAELDKFIASIERELSEEIELIEQKNEREEEEREKEREEQIEAWERSKYETREFYDYLKTKFGITSDDFKDEI